MGVVHESKKQANLQPLAGHAISSWAQIGRLLATNFGGWSKKLEKRRPERQNGVQKSKKMRPKCKKRCPESKKGALEAGGAQSQIRAPADISANPRKNRMPVSD